MVQQAKWFELVVFEHIPRVQNEEPDHLSRLTTTYYDELINEFYVEIREKPADEENSSLRVLQEPEDWTTAITRYLVKGPLPGDVTEARKIKYRSFRFHMYNGELYKKSWDGLLLSCVSKEDIHKIIAEVHQGWSGSHIGGRSLAVKNT
ncbi:hypothetical protein LIER_09470 [Lithospermum erythrorhizon]|uniref:Uncharacterized protein n=1 Tax=Lithospermum erythrorhizon TaxID=34254 RepID=A0AAV3PFN5_LITER